MHVIEEVTAHQAVPASPEDIDARTSGDDETYSVSVAVEKTLQQSLPLRVFVQFVERSDWSFCSENI
jgi:hypothetical protein